MKDTHYEETRYGFEYGAVSVERMWSHKGRVCIRLVCRGTRAERYVDVEVTPKGNKMYVSSGSEKDG